MFNLSDASDHVVRSIFFADEASSVGISRNCDPIGFHVQTPCPDPLTKFPLSKFLRSVARIASDRFFLPQAGRGSVCVRARVGFRPYRFLFSPHLACVRGQKPHPERMRRSSHRVRISQVGFAEHFVKTTWFVVYHVVRGVQCHHVSARCSELCGASTWDCILLVNVLGRAPFVPSCISVFRVLRVGVRSRDSTRPQDVKQGSPCEPQFRGPGPSACQWACKALANAAQCERKARLVRVTQHATKGHVCRRCG